MKLVLEQVPTSSSGARVNKIGGEARGDDEMQRRDSFCEDSEAVFSKGV